VMSLLKLTELTEERHLMLASACSELANETDEFVEQLKIARIKTFKDVDWASVKRVTHLHAPSKAEVEIIDSHRKRAAWLQILTLERRAYVHQFEEGLLGSVGFSILDNFMVLLIAHTDRAAHNDEISADACADRIAALYDEELKALLERLQNPMKAMRFYVCCGVNQSTKAAAMAYEVCLGYLWGQESVQKITRHAGNAEKEFAAIRRDHEQSKERTIETMHLLQRRYPHSIKRFKTVHAAARVLRNQRRECEHKVHVGMLEELDAGKLLDGIHEKLARLYAAPYSKKVTSMLHHGAMSAFGRTLDAAEELDRHVTGRAKGTRRIVPAPSLTEIDDANVDSFTKTTKPAAHQSRFGNLQSRLTPSREGTGRLEHEVERGKEMESELREVEAGVHAAVHISHLMRENHARVAAPHIEGEPGPAPSAAVGAPEAAAGAPR